MGCGKVAVRKKLWEKQKAVWLEVMSNYRLSVKYLYCPQMSGTCLYGNYSKHTNLFTNSYDNEYLSKVKQFLINRKISI